MEGFKMKHHSINYLLLVTIFILIPKEFADYILLQCVKVT